MLKTGPISADDHLIESTVNYVVAVRDWIRNRIDVPFGIVLVPSQHHLNPGRFRRYLQHLNVPLQQYDATRIHKIFRASLENHDLNVLDMTPIMMLADELLSFPDDGHLNSTGHLLVANGLAKFLESKFGLNPE